MLKRFTLRCALFLLLVFVLDKGLLIFRNQAPAYAPDPRLQLVLDGELAAELLVMGSSRADESVLNPLLEDLTGRRVYNLAYHGSEIEFSAWLLQQYLAHQPAPASQAIAMPRYQAVS